MRIAVVLSTVLLTGCVLHNLNPRERLRDAVVELNDELRWSRVDLAARRVKGPYKRKFARLHQDWGKLIQIGDVEILDMRVGNDFDHATSFVVFHWYSEETMIIRTTKVRQDWARESGEYILTKVTVIDGDDELLTAEEKDAPEGETNRKRSQRKAG